MTLQQLRYFRVLAQTLHYTKASEKLHISQPSLSYAISELEKDLGVFLFEKKDKRITLNRYGILFLSYVEKSLDTLDEATSLLRLSINPIHGTVNLGYFYSLSSHIPKLIEAFYQNVQNSSIIFNFVQELNSSLKDSLRSGKIDLAFCLEEDPELSTVPILRQELFVIVSASHPLANRSSVSIAELLDEHLVLLNRDSALRSWTERAFSSLGFPLPPIAFEAQECNAALQFVSLNFGISIIPQVPAIDAIGVKRIGIEGIDSSRLVYLAWAKDRRLIPPAQKLRDFILSTRETSTWNRGAEENP